MIAAAIEKPGDDWIDYLLDRYAGMLYSVLTEVCQSSAGAGIALTRTFEEIINNPAAWRGKKVNAICLLKLAIHTARQHVPVIEPVSINCFRAYTLLHYFICENGTIETLCERSGLQRAEIAKQLHLEINRMSRLSLR